MIRRKVSNGLLRAATQAQPHAQVAAPASISAAHASQHQTANLASSVLLSSQRNWKGETVNTLKSELKKRGLSQTGNKWVHPSIQLFGPGSRWPCGGG